MKVPKKVALALGLFLLAACGGLGGGGGQGGMSQEEFSQAWDRYTQTQQQVVQQLIQDPAFQAFQAFLGNPMGALSVGSLSLVPSGGAFPGLFPLLNPRPLNHPSGNELPRGGRDYTDPNNPRTYTPSYPYDLGLKWTAPDHVVAELLVDWDKNSTATLWPHDPTGRSREAPQAAQAHMTLGNAGVGHADFGATWYNCSTTRTYILEPTRLTFSGYLGQTARLSWEASYRLTEGDQHQIQAGLDLSLSTQGTNPTFRLSLELTLNGQLTRGPNCFPQSFQPQGGFFTLTSQAGSEKMVFQLQVTRVQWTDGRPTRVDLNGYVDYNGRRAVSFSGYLDEGDLDGTDPCPGENVILTFRDGTVTLRAWLQNHGACRP